mmetsp:Transcript_27961/g.43613  ORF Transcript_27961/g.43613 Transcript_27961/m.43613 type:complete len:84 (-) Transcript_27961:189-440(-)
MIYERETMLPEILQGITGGRQVNDQLCSEAEKKIEGLRAEGKLVALPALKVIKEEVPSDSATPGVEEKVYRLKVIFEDKTLNS